MNCGKDSDVLLRRRTHPSTPTISSLQRRTIPDAAPIAIQCIFKANHVNNCRVLAPRVSLLVAHVSDYYLRPRALF